MNEQQIYSSDFLFSDMNFFSGMGTVLNLAGNYFNYNISQTSEEADYKALLSDWGMVGNDLKFALEKFKKEHDETTK